MPDPSALGDESQDSRTISFRQPDGIRLHPADRVVADSERVPAMATVGLVANPLAGTDVRRLRAPAGHTSHAAKVAIMCRVASAALVAGAELVLVADDTAGLGRQVVDKVGGGVALLDDPGLGCRLDTVAATRSFWKAGCGAVVVLGGDGTCRDVANGWPDVPLIALSTGTNNVFPRLMDPVAAGTAAGLIAARRVPIDVVCQPTKRLASTVFQRTDKGTNIVGESIALVDIGILSATSIGARAVLHAHEIRAVVAAVASPMASGLSSIAGRIAPLERDDPDGVVIYLGSPTTAPAAARQVQIPLVPGEFSTVSVERVEPLRRGSSVTFDGPCVLAFDGERDIVVGPNGQVRITVDTDGPRVIDVEATLRLAVRRQAFDVLKETNDG